MARQDYSVLNREPVTGLDVINHGEDPIRTPLPVSDWVEQNQRRIAEQNVTLSEHARRRAAAPPKDA